MQTFHYDSHGYSVNGVADCWRHMLRAPCFTTVFIHGLEGWTGSTTCYAVTDDFGDLVPVRLV